MPPMRFDKPSALSAQQEGHRAPDAKGRCMEKIAISLFAGAGGMDIGFEQAGYEVRVAVEQDKRCCETLLYNAPQKIVIGKKIEEVTAEEILKAGRVKRGRADIVIGGPPCQGFSQLGPKNPYDPRNFLFKDFFRIVEGVAPAKL